MSRKMLCQLSGPQLVEWAQKVIDMSAGKEEQYGTFGEMLEKEVADPKTRLRMGTALVGLAEAAKRNLTAHDILRVIRWEPDAKGNDLEIQFHKSAVLRQQARAQDERDMAMNRLREWAALYRMFGGE